MKKIWILAAIVFIFAFPPTIANDSWIKIIEPSPGIYWQGEKIFSLENAIVMIRCNDIHIEAEGSENIIAVYFSMYDIRNKDMIASFWDTYGNDGWSCDFDLEKGIYIIAAAGAALDIEEPVAIDWITLIAW